MLLRVNRKILLRISVKVQNFQIKHDGVLDSPMTWRNSLKIQSGFSRESNYVLKENT